VKLIDRSKRPLVPTAQGKLYYEGCRELVSRYMEVENRVKALENAAHIAGVLNIASIYSVGLVHLSRYVDSFRARYPAVEVRLEFLHPSRVLEAVRGGDADLGLISFPRKWADLTVIPWREEEMVLAVNPEHALASRGEIAVTELDGSRLVGFDAGLSIRRAIDRFLRRHQAMVETGPEFDNIENIKRAVEALPGGAAILPQPTIARECAGGSLSPVRFTDARLVRPLAVVHRRLGELSLCASQFLRHLSVPAPLEAGGADPAPLTGRNGPKRRGQLAATTARDAP
jgi:DNA-binding transcriptional LysR family regulator